MAVEAEAQASRAEQTERRQAVKDLLMQRMDEDLAELSPSELRILARELKRMSRKERPESFLDSDLARGILWGAGGMALALLLFPQLRQTLRPLAVAAATGVMGLADKTGEVLSKAKDAMEDVVAEAQFKRMQEAAESEPAPDLQEDEP